MQKSKIATYGVIVCIILYTILGINYSLNANRIYMYIINPLFWVILSFVVYKLFGKTYENHKIKRTITQYTLIACLVYIIVYLVSGLFVTFGKNPYLTNLKGVIINLWMLGIPIVSREYLRYKLIRNVYEKDTIKIAVIVTVLFALIEFKFWKLIGGNLSFYTIFTQIFEHFVPIFAKNILYTYLAINLNFTASIAYELITNLYLWISPILPNSPWVMNAIIDTSIPMVLFLYVRYTKNKLDRFRTKEKIINSDPKNIIPLIIVIILAIWFAIGIFPIKPIAIASRKYAK